LNEDNFASDVVNESVTEKHKLRLFQAITLFIKFILDIAGTLL
jgi:hypothetical protein